MGAMISQEHLTKRGKTRVAYHLEELFRDAAADLGLSHLWIEWSTTGPHLIDEVEIRYTTGYRRRINGRNRTLVELIGDIAKAV